MLDLLIFYALTALVEGCVFYWWLITSARKDARRGEGSQFNWASFLGVSLLAAALWPVIFVWGCVAELNNYRSKHYGG
jgi:hypothetical protein